MFSLNSKLSKWVQQGLVSAEQVESIKAFEKEQQGGSFFKGVFGLGVFAILIGVAAIVSANWDVISDFTKISIHAVFYLCALGGIVMAHKKENIFFRDVALFFFMGLTLTFILLLDHIYAVSGKIADNLALWMLIVTPVLLFYGRSKIVFWPWFIGFLVAYFSNVEQYFSFSNYTAYPVLSMSVFALGCLHLAGFIKQKYQDSLRDILFYCGFIACLISANISLVLGHDIYRNMLSSTETFVFISLFAGLAVSVFALRFNFDFIKGAEEKYFRFVLLATLFVSATICLPLAGQDFISMILFIGFWIFAGYCFQKMGWQRMVSVSIGAVGMRLYWLYLDVFGSLLETGIGLIVSGSLLVGGLYAFKKINHHLVGKNKS